MAIYKVSIFMRSGVIGWSENYYNQAGTPADAIKKARQLAQARTALNGDDVDTPFIRVSDVAIRGDSVLDGQPGFTTNPTPLNGLIQIKNASVGQKADVAWTSALFSHSFGNVTLARTYARGLADESFVADRVFNPSQQWDNFFLLYKQVLLTVANGWGVLRTPKSTPGNTYPIGGATAVLGSNLVLTVDPLLAAPAGTTVSIRGLKSDQGTLNGKFLVTAVAGVFLTIAKQFPNPQPSFTPHTGNAQKVLPTFITPLEASYSRQATSRRGGRPFGSLVGRRKKPALLR